MRTSKLLAIPFVFLWGALVWAVLDYTSPAPSPTYSPRVKSTLPVVFSVIDSFDEPHIICYHFRGQALLVHNERNERDENFILLKPLRIATGEDILQLPVGKALKTMVMRTQALNLQNGKIFLCGGSALPDDALQQDQSVRWHISTPTNKTWIYDLRSGAVLEGPPMVIACTDPKLTLLSDGRVLITGGYLRSPFNSVTNVQVYDPKSNSLKDYGKMCVPRYAHAVVELNNGKILIMSGHTSDGFIDAYSDLTGTAEIIDLSIKKSKLIGSLREPRADAMAVAFGPTRAIVFGGHGRWLEGDDSFLEILNSDLPPIGRDAATFVELLNDDVR